MKDTRTWLIIILTLVVILLILFNRPKPESDLVQRQTAVIERKQSEIKERDLQISVLINERKRDSTLQAEERKSFIERYTALKSKLKKQRAKVDTVILSDPDLSKFVNLQDSVIDLQAARIDTLESDLSDLRINAAQVEQKFREQIADQVEMYAAQKDISDDYRKQLRKVRRGNRVWKAAAVVFGVGGLFAGSHL